MLGWLPIEWQDRLGAIRRYRLLGARGSSHAILARVDGTTFHGGLTDRWKGIISLYALSKATKRDFRLLYTFPFQLTDYQVPAAYDWQLREGELSENVFQVTLKRLIGDPSLQRVQRLAPDKQIHGYANRDWMDAINETYHTQFTWGELFRELFTPSARLNAALEPYRKRLNKPYIAVAFRTQNLFGDYTEYHYQPADAVRQAQVIQSCLSFLQELHAKEGFPILVTSDSERLAEQCATLPFVTASCGKAAHADTSANSPQEQYLKSFVDFYLLAEAQAVYCAGTKEMYPSDFPKYAAKVYDVPFHRVALD